MNYANDAVLEALHLVQYRQIPWHKRPAVLTSLRGLGLIDTARQQPPVDVRYFSPVHIAVLSEHGKRELLRLEALSRSKDWEQERLADYLYEALPLS